MPDPFSRHLLRSSRPDAVTAPLLLMYHGTPDTRPPASARYAVQAAAFAAQLDLLQAFGYRTCRVRDLGAEPLTGRTVAITFDDGYADNIDGALQALVRRGMCATWFIVSAQLGHRADWIAGDVPGAELMTAQQVRELAVAGMEVGAHTRTHVDLTRCSPAQLDDEVRGSRADLEHLLQQPVESFAYPFGRHAPAAVAAVAAAGYRQACSVRPGWYSPSEPRLLRRVTIERTETLSSFARKLALADNDVSWQAMARYGFARLRARLRPRAA